MRDTELHHPWQEGPTELLAYALEHYHKRSEFSRKLAFLLIDVSVEAACKTFLGLPNDVTGSSISFAERKKFAQGNFHDLLQGVRKTAGKRLEGVDLGHINHFHSLRNELYHGPNGITVQYNQTKDYATIAVQLLLRLLGVDLRLQLLPPDKRDTRMGEIQEQLSYLKSKIANELDAFEEHLPEFVETVESSVLLPSFSRTWFEWASEQRDISFFQRVDQPEYQKWAVKIQDTIPDNLRVFADRYLFEDRSLSGSFRMKNGIFQIYFTPLMDWMEKLSIIVRTVRVHGENAVSLQTIRDHACILIAEKQLGVFVNLRDHLRQIEFFQTPLPPTGPDEDEIDVAQSWLLSREEGLRKIQSLNTKLSELI